MENLLYPYWQLFIILISAIIGWIVGTMKSFREEKQKAYGEILPPILKMAYHPESSDEKEYCKALSKLWIYSSKRVALKMETALAIMANESRGNKTTAIQEAVVEMRKDIQIWSWQQLNTKDVNHLYTRIVSSHENT